MPVVAAARAAALKKDGGGPVSPQQKKDDTYIPFCCKFMVTGFVLSLLVTGISFLVISGDASKRCAATEAAEEAQQKDEASDPKRYEVHFDRDPDGVTQEWKRNQLLPPDVTLDPNAESDTDKVRKRVIVKEVNRWGTVVAINTANTGRRRRLPDTVGAKISGGKSYTPSGGAAYDGTDAVVNPCASTQSYTTTGAIMLSFGVIGLVIAVAVVTEGCRCFCSGGLKMCVREAERISVISNNPKSLAPDELQMSIVANNDQVLELSERSSNL